MRPRYLDYDSGANTFVFFAEHVVKTVLLYNHVAKSHRKASKTPRWRFKKRKANCIYVLSDFTRKGRNFGSLP